MPSRFINETSFWLPKYTGSSAWTEHAPFAFWLIDAFRPKTVVELGARHGFSYFTFCQAVERLGLLTRCYVVDTWQGDESAGFDASVFKNIFSYNEANYSAFSEVIRLDFVKEGDFFPAKSIDFLCIDGCHSYNHAKELFYSWKPKLSDEAIVLFHSIDVPGGGIGVHELWEELRAKYPNFYFNHGHGLGVIAVGKVRSLVLKELFEISDAEADLVRMLYARLGRGVAGTTDACQLEERQAPHASELNKLIAERDSLLAEKEAVIASRSSLLASLAEKEGRLANQLRVHAKQKAEQELIIARLTKKERQARSALTHMQQSTSWRVTNVLLSGLRVLPHSVRLTLRRGFKAMWWALTPHKLPERLALMHARKQPVPKAKLASNKPRRTSSKKKGHHLFFLPDMLKSDINSTADHNGRYVLREQSGGYTYLPPRRPKNFNDVLAGLTRRPRFSIVVPTYNTTAELLSRMLASVKAQWYPDWQLVLADDSSPLAETRSFLSSIDDPQVRVVFLDKNSGISGATNAALEKAEGDYIVLLDHDDELTEDCLYELALCIDREDPDYIYSDEDKIDEGGRFTQPFFKPDWSPDALMSIMYTCHVSCIRRSLLQEVGLFRSEFNGSQDWDLVLRVTEKTKRIAHIPKVLYHWRIIQGSASGVLAAKPYALDAGRRAREAALERRGLTGVIEPIEQIPGHYRVRYSVQGTPLISIIIPSRNNGTVLRRCVESLFATSTWRRFEVVVLDNGSNQPETLEILRALSERNGVRVIRHDAPFNYSELNNIGVREAQGDVLLFLNDDTELLTSDGLERMLGYAQLPHVGGVGAKLLYPQNMQVQHAGVINIAPGPSHAFLYQPADAPGYFMRNLLEYNWVAVTGACLMVERKKFDAVGGFDEAFPVAYNDVELCFRLIKQGLYHVVSPSAKLLHYESLSRGNDHESPERRARLDADRHRLFAKHPEFFLSDPFYNSNLYQGSVQFEVPV